MVFPEGNKLFAGDIRANPDEINADMVNLQRDGTGNRLSNIKGTFAESLQVQVSVLLHQSMCIFKAGLSSLYDCWAKYKEKVPDVSGPNQCFEATCISNSKFT